MYEIGKLKVVEIFEEVDARVSEILLAIREWQMVTICLKVQWVLPADDSVVRWSLSPSEA